MFRGPPSTRLARGQELWRFALGVVLSIGLGAAGIALVSAAGIALPGAVAGMALLALLIRVLPVADSGASAVFDRVSPHMVLLFVPAGSGIFTQAQAIAENWAVVAVAVLLATPAAVAVVALTACAVFSWRLHGRGEHTS